MSDHLTPLRIQFRRVGLVLTVVSAVLTAAFGWTLGSNLIMAALLALGLAVATFASAYVWPFVADAWQRKAWISASIMTAFGILVTTTDVTTNFGAVSWQRTTEIQTAAVQNIKFDDRRDAVQEGRASLEMWTKRLTALEAEHAWAATVTAEALRAQLASANLAIEQEAKRGGCGPKCLARTKERDDIATRIALAEEKADLTKKIEATKRVLAERRDVAAETKKAESAGLLQNTALASMFTLSLAPSTEAQHWTDKGVSWLVAAFFAFGAMGCNWVGWTSSRRREHFPQGRPEAQPAPTQILDDFITNMNRHIPKGVPKFA
jgi:hypothetical protein